MNARDLAEIKRRLNPDHRNPTVIQGCYINSDGTEISRFTKPVGMLSQEENEKYMMLFKKVLTGTMGQNLLNIDFTTEQVESSQEYEVLVELCDSALQNEHALDFFYQKATTHVQAQREQQAQSVDAAQNASNYLVLLMHDGYDVPYRDQNGDIDRERSEALFSFVLCCICPVKQSKPALTYLASEGDFHSRPSDWVVGMPDLGFMFPAFEERGANINRAVFYTRNAEDLHDAFIQAVFAAQVQMTAGEQKETFQTILQETLADECSLDVVQTVHETISTMIAEQKADKTAEPLTLSKLEMKKVLEESGVSEEKTAAFEEKYEATFGEKASLPAVNMITPKQFKVETPSVSIRVDPEHRDLIETRMIDGKYYILVLADGEVEVNGMRLTK